MTNTLRSFELFVARRYLVAKRRQAIVSMVTIISVVGVAAGVMALVVALAINNGFRQTLQRLLLGTTPHVLILEKTPGEGIKNWREVVKNSATVAGVKTVSPALYGSVLFSGPIASDGGFLKGLPDGREGAVVLGSRLAHATGMLKGSRVTIINPHGEVTPFGMRPSYHRLPVADTFESGFYDIDARFGYTSIKTAQSIFGAGDAVNAVELYLYDIHDAQTVADRVAKFLGTELDATTWMEQNRALLAALDTERTVTVVTIGLIELVAALNILITLTMMVMEKNRDIAMLVSMGATVPQIRRIFLMQGFLIGVAGTILGLAAGYVLCYFAGTQKWIKLDEQVYALGYLPFEPRWVDAVWVALAAVGISLLATIYPARHAARVVPAEALRYE